MGASWGGGIKVAPPTNRGAHKTFRGGIFRYSFGLFSVLAIYEVEISAKFLLRPAAPLRWPHLEAIKNGFDPF